MIGRPQAGRAAPTSARGAPEGGRAGGAPRRAAGGAAEVGPVGQHRERRGPAALVGADLLGDDRRGRDLTGAGRAALELGDQREAGADQRLVEGPILAAGRQPRLEVGLRELATTGGDALPGSIDELIDYSHLTLRA